MSPEQLELGKKVVERAEEISRKLSALDSALNHEDRTNVSWVRWNTDEPLLPEDLLRDVIKLGCETLSRQLKVDLDVLVFPVTSDQIRIAAHEP